MPESNQNPKRRRPVKASRRTAAPEERRQQLIEATIRCVANRGLAQTTIATVRFPLRMPAYADPAQVEESIAALVARTTKWDLPHSTPGTTSAWQLLRAELGKVAEGYEMSSKDLPAR